MVSLTAISSTLDCDAAMLPTGRRPSIDSFTWAVEDLAGRSADRLDEASSRQIAEMGLNGSRLVFGLMGSLELAAERFALDAIAMAMRYEAQGVPRPRPAEALRMKSQRALSGLRAASRIDRETYPFPSYGRLPEIADRMTQIEPQIIALVREYEQADIAPVAARPPMGLHRECCSGGRAGPERPAGSEPLQVVSPQSRVDESR